MARQPIWQQGQLCDDLGHKLPHQFKRSSAADLRQQLRADRLRSAAAAPIPVSITPAMTAAANVRTGYRQCPQGMQHNDLELKPGGPPARLPAGTCRPVI